MDDFRDIQAEALKRCLALHKTKYKRVSIQISIEKKPSNIVRLKEQEQLTVLDKDINELEAEHLSAQIKKILYRSNCNNKQTQIPLQEIFKGCVNMDIKVSCEFDLLMRRSL